MASAFVAFGLASAFAVGFLFLGMGIISSSRSSSSSSNSKLLTSAIIAAFLLGALDLGLIISLFVLCSVEVLALGVVLVTEVPAVEPPRPFLAAPFCTDGCLEAAAFGVEASFATGFVAFVPDVEAAFLAAGVCFLLSAVGVGVLAFGGGAAFLVVLGAFAGGVDLGFAISIGGFDGNGREPLFLGVGMISSSSWSSDSYSSMIGLDFAFLAVEPAVEVLAIFLAFSMAGNFFLGGDFVLGFLAAGVLAAGGFLGVVVGFCLRSAFFFLRSSSSS